MAGVVQRQQYVLHHIVDAIGRRALRCDPANDRNAFAPQRGIGRSVAGLLGGVAGALSSDPAALGLFFIAFTATFAAFYWREVSAEGRFGITSVVAAMLTFSVGAYAVKGEPRVAVAIGVAMTLLLALKQPLHRWVRRLTWPEMRATLTLLAMSFLLLPVLPDRSAPPDRPDR